MSPSRILVFDNKARPGKAPAIDGFHYGKYDVEILVRYSTGIEDTVDLLEDLKQALEVFR